jgi:hypothetical protein
MDRPVRVDGRMQPRLAGGRNLAGGPRRPVAGNRRGSERPHVLVELLRIVILYAILSSSLWVLLTSH